MYCYCVFLHLLLEAVHLLPEKKKTKNMTCFLAFSCSARQKKKLDVGVLIMFTWSFWLEQEAHLSCRRQLCRLLRGSLLTEVDGFSNSSNREAGTGQSGILTGVTGLDGFPSLFSSMRCCSNKTIITGMYFVIYHLQQALLIWYYTNNTGL